MLISIYIVRLVRSMFNPKEALEQIRRAKLQKEEANLVQSSVAPMEPRLSALQQTVKELSAKLESATDTISILKKENSNLQTQLLRLEYENSQLQTANKYSEVRKSNYNSRALIENGLNQSIDLNLTNRNSFLNNENTNVVSQRNNIQQSISNLSVEKKTIASLTPKQYSVEVEKTLQNLREEPVENILRRKQHQFRALKLQTGEKKVLSGNKCALNANKCLQELASIQKEYCKYIQKPVLLLSFTEDDFQ